MSGQEGKILGFSSQEMIRWGLVLLLIVTSIGSIIQGGALSGKYDQLNIMVYIPVLLFMYFSVLALMYMMGMKPNKFERIVIPLIVVGMIIAMLAAANILPKAQNQNGNNNGIISTSVSSDFLPTNRPTESSNQSIGRGSQITFISSNSNLEQLYRNIATSLSIIFLLAFLGFGLYWIITRQHYDPDIQIHKMNEYAKSAFDSNNTIIEYYIDASNQIERIKGLAPSWFSPTNFSNHVIESPGPPLSSYFDSLTIIYEQARFGEKEMSQEKVDEVKDLHRQILSQIDAIFQAKLQQTETMEEEQ